MTICVKCRHHFNLEPTGPRSNVWYNQICTHHELERTPEIDPVTGEEGYALKNDIGRVVVTHEKHPHCRDINHGNCPHYEPKP